MSLSAKEAAEQVGMSKQGILKAVKQGKLSAQKDPHGEWRIEPAELFRVYSPVNHSSQQLEPTSSQQHTPENTLGVHGLQREIELLREQIALLKDERDDGALVGGERLERAHATAH